MLLESKLPINCHLTCQPSGSAMVRKLLLRFCAIPPFAHIAPMASVAKDDCCCFLPRKLLDGVAGLHLIVLELLFERGHKRGSYTCPTLSHPVPPCPSQQQHSMEDPCPPRSSTGFLSPSWLWWAATRLLGWEGHNHVSKPQVQTGKLRRVQCLTTRTSMLIRPSPPSSRALVLRLPCRCGWQ